MRSKNLRKKLDLRKKLSNTNTIFSNLGAWIASRSFSGSYLLYFESGWNTAAFSPPPTYLFILLLFTRRPLLTQMSHFLFLCRPDGEFRIVRYHRTPHWQCWQIAVWTTYSGCNTIHQPCQLLWRASAVCFKKVPGFIRSGGDKGETGDRGPCAAPKTFSGKHCLHKLDMAILTRHGKLITLNPLQGGASFASLVAPSDSHWTICIRKVLTWEDLVLSCFLAITANEREQS